MLDKGLGEELRRSLLPTLREPAPEGFRINVHAAVSRFAVLYERIRNAVDYKDEHLLRRAAIARILKRQLILEKAPDAVAQNLVRELIGARYLPNNELPESLIGDVALRIKKYQAIESTRVGTPAHLNWLRDVLVVEIEEFLVDATPEKALITFLYERVADRIQISGVQMEETDVRLQVYIAVCRTLVKANNDALSFKLLRAYLPEWLRPDEWINDPTAIAERLIGVEQRIRLSLSHPQAPRIQRAVKPWAVALNLLKDALLEKPSEATNLLEKPELLQAAVARLAERQYRDAKARLRRGAVRAIIYIFFTKMLIAFVLEVPLEQAIYHAVAYSVLAINLLFPPFLMFFVALFIRVPGKDNTAKLQSSVATLLTKEGVPSRELRVRPVRGNLARVLLSAAYAMVYLLIFGLISTFLIQLHFTWISATIFIFFLCTVSFFAFRLRQNARENVVVEEKESVRSLIMDLISLPILRAGHLLARGVQRINVFLFFFDFLLEAPFKIFLTVLEEWFSFLKEKKEELQ